VAVVLFAALTAVVLLQVLNRLVLHLPIIWSEEAARFLFFWVVLLGAAQSVRRRRHLVLDIAMGRRPGRRARFVLDLVPDLAILGFSVFLLAQGIGYAYEGLLRTAPNSGVSMGLVFAAIPVFALLSIGYTAVNLAADWRNFREGRTRDDRPAAAE
jgi:TRAP-type C4-dicarboxylate transport system permease small subunit